MWIVLVDDDVDGDVIEAIGSQRKLWVKVPAWDSVGKS